MEASLRPLMLLGICVALSSSCIHVGYGPTPIQLREMAVLAKQYPFLFAEPSRVPAATYEWRQVFRDCFEELPFDWTKFEEDVDATQGIAPSRYCTDCGSVTRHDLLPAYDGGFVLRVSANEALNRSLPNNHVIAQRRNIRDHAVAGRWRMQFYVRIPGTTGPGQTGPEFSMHNSRIEDSWTVDGTVQANVLVSKIVGLQYWSNVHHDPALGEAAHGHWAIWTLRPGDPADAKPSWVVLPKEEFYFLLETDHWYRCTFYVDFSENNYGGFYLEDAEDSMTLLRQVDLRKYVVQDEVRWPDGEAEFSITLEAQNEFREPDPDTDPARHEVWYDCVELCHWEQRPVTVASGFWHPFGPIIVPYIPE